MRWLLLLLLTLPLVAQAQLRYEVVGGGITITGYNCVGSALEIPSKIDDLTVTSIGDAAFRYCTTLTEVTIPTSVTSIGHLAFIGCTSLAHVSIPSSVRSVGQNSFAYCTKLASVTLSNGITNIGDYAFYGCTRLARVTIPSSVSSIGDSAFSTCTSLSSITLSGGLAKMGYSAFAECTNLENVTISSGVISIGDYAFLRCTRLACVTIPSSTLSVGVSAFNGCTSLTSVTISRGVASLGAMAFRGCTSLASLTIPGSVTNIGDQAFQDCTGLASATISSGVTNLGMLAFAFCTSLSSLTIPDSVRSIGEEAFYGCTGLSCVKMPVNLTSIGGELFAFCASLVNIAIPNGVTRIGFGAFRDCNSLTSITVPSNVTNIDNYAFLNCPSLSSVYFEGDAPSLGLDVFTLADKSTLYYLNGTQGWTSNFGGRPTKVWTPHIQTTKAASGVFANPCEPDVNTPPKIGGIPDLTVDENRRILFMATATDNETLSPGLVFSLDPCLSAGATILSDGRFRWRIAEDQGPGIYTFTIRVKDGAHPPLSDSATFRVTVNEVNSPPVFDPRARYGKVGQMMTFATAVDTDIPVQSLQFRLGIGSPTGLSVDPITGMVMWTPAADQAGLHSVTVIATDTGTPPLTSSHAYTINILGSDQTLLVGDIAVVGSTLTVRSPGTVGKSYQLEYVKNPSTPPWLPLGAAVRATSATVSFSDTVAAGVSRFYRIVELP